MDYPELILRSVVGFVVLIAASRVIGQKNNVLLGVGIAVFTALCALESDINVWGVLIATAIWCALYILMTFVSLKSYAFRRLVGGKPTVVIEQGKVLEDNLKKAKVTVNDMMAMLREKNAFKLSEVEFGVLEADGQMSVMKKADSSPLTPVIQGIPIENERAPRVVVIDGKIHNKTLEDMGFSQGWLWGELLKQGAQKIDDVVLAQVDAKGNVYVDLKADVMQPAQVKARPLLLASLKKIQADLEIYALQTGNQFAKQEYTVGAEQLQSMIKKVEPFLRE